MVVFTTEANRIRRSYPAQGGETPPLHTPSHPGSNDCILLCSTSIRSICNDFYWITKKIHTSFGRLGGGTDFSSVWGPNVISVLCFSLTSVERKRNWKNAREQHPCPIYIYTTVLISSSGGIADYYAGTKVFTLWVLSYVFPFCPNTISVNRNCFVLIDSKLIILHNYHVPTV